VNNKNKTKEQLIDEVASLRARIVQLEKAETGGQGNGSQSVYRTLLEHIPQKIFYKDRDSVYVAVNKSYSADFGVSSGDFVGKTDYDFFSTELADKYRADDRRIMTSGTVEEMDETYQHNGEMKLVHTLKAPVREENGDIIGTFGVFWDITERTRAEEISARLAAIVESSDDAIIAKSLDGTVVSWNKAAERMYGYSADEATGRHISFLFPPGCSEDPLHLLSKIRRGEHVHRYETTRQRKDGSIISVSLTISPVRNANGEITGASTIAQDITDFKKMERALRTSEERFSRAFNAIPTSIGIIRLEDSRYIEVNEAFVRMWGYGRDEVIGKSVPDLGIWLHIEQWEYVSRLLADQGRIRDLEIRFRTKTGNESITLSSAEPIEVAGKPCMLLVSVDITERAQAAEVLRRVNAYNHGLMEARLDPLVVMGPDGRITDVNVATEQITGWARDSLIGTDFSEYFIEPEKAQTAYRQALREGVVRDCLLDLRHRDGRVASVLYNASVCWDEDGRFIGVVAVAHDITIRKQAEARLKESEERYRTAIEHSNDGVAIAKGSRHLYVNHKFLEIFGYDHSIEIIGDRTLKHIHPDDRELILEYSRKRERGEEAPSRYGFKGVKKDGSMIFVEASVASINYHGEPASLAYLRDVTERRQLEEKLRTMSIVDDLTGVYNRRGFITLAQQQLKLADRTKERLDLFFIDLDDMKWINDALGHQEGDAALVEAAGVLRRTFRKSDIIGRFGGDEFAVLAINTADGSRREDLMKRLHNILDSGNKPETRKYRLSLSVGAVSYDPDHPVALDHLIATADALMYEEKKGKNHRT
jgi:diguanylate cyclase (GGDEF)-like protein/PAS domain S-box-containing protein